MFDVSLWISAGLWTLFLLQTLLNWALVPDLSKWAGPMSSARPFVSIVVPARNEERGIERAVDSFCSQDYGNFEVIVVDDRSTDRTPEILRELQTRYANLTVIQGTDPPEGWLGKPNALDIGRKAATGDWLLFVDADVVYAPDLLRRAIAFALERDAGMLVLTPRLTTGEVIEAVIMSALPLVIFACVPFFLAARRKSKWMAVGNGVFNLVRRDALHACGAFDTLKDAVLDDVGLGYAVKRSGHAMAVGLAGPLATIRMYYGTREVVHGFTKNAFPMVRQYPWLIVFPFVLGAIVSLVPYIGLAIGLQRGVVDVPSVIALTTMHVVMGFLAVHFRQRWYVTFLTPLREICWWGILIRSVVIYRRHGIVWRGRRYAIPPAK